MSKLRAILIIVLVFNLFFQVAFWNNVSIMFTNFVAEKEYTKLKVKIDSMGQDYELLTESSKGITYYEFFYSNPDGAIIFVDDSDYLFRTKDEKSNIEQVMDFYRNHHDSILIWHHPKYQDTFAKEKETRFRDSFNWLDITLRTFWFLIAILTLYNIIYRRLG